MGLDGRDDISDDLIGEGNDFLGGIIKKIKFPILFILIGIICGALLTHYYIEPFIGGEKSDPSDIISKTNELLNKENDCLYSLLDNAKTDVKKCSATYIDTNSL